MEEDENIYTFEDFHSNPDPIFEYRSNSAIPIVIDNGSFKCRAGWANDVSPKLQFKNVLTKARGKKESDVLIGNDISNLEVLRWQLKTPFDRNIVTHYDAQEQVFDYIFSHLGLDTEGKVHHPIVMTEALCNPNSCRHQMSELLFEAYHVPGIVYGIDALFGFHNNFNNINPENALIVSCGYHSIEILPILNRRLQVHHSRRINIGGFELDSFLQRLLQLKYPAHSSVLTLSRAEEITLNHCKLADDYLNELSHWSSEDYYMKNAHIFELPHSEVQLNIANAEAQREKKEAHIKKMKAINAKKREERLEADQEELRKCLSLLERESEDEEAFEIILAEHGFEDVIDLLMVINRLHNRINIANNRILSEELEDLVDGPKMKKPKEDRKKILIEDFENSNSQEEMEDILNDIKSRRQDLIERRERRKQIKSDMAKRRTFASQQRMKIISELAQSSATNKKKPEKDDNFGENDDDWNVYKEISKDADDSDSEYELEQIDEWEAILKEYDPSFVDPNLNEFFDPKEYYRLYIGVEQIRIPELMFQPSMIGCDQAGIAETLEFVLKKFSYEDQNKLTQNVYITGGAASFPGMKKKIESSLLSMRPFRSSFKVYTAKDFSLDAWYGAQKFAQMPNLQDYCLSKQDYDEKGMDYLKEHSLSNIYYKTPFVDMKKYENSNRSNQDFVSVIDSL